MRKSFSEWSNEIQPLKIILIFENSQFLTAQTQKVLRSIKKSFGYAHWDTEFYWILPETLWNSIIVNMLIIGSSTTAGSDKRKTSKKNSGIPMHVHLASAVEKDKKKESSWSEHTWSKYLLFCILFILKIFSCFTECIRCVVQINYA